MDHCWRSYGVPVSCPICLLTWNAMNAIDPAYGNIRASGDGNASLQVDPGFAHQECAVCAVEEGIISAMSLLSVRYLELTSVVRAIRLQESTPSDWALLVSPLLVLRIRYAVPRLTPVSLLPDVSSDLVRFEHNEAEIRLVAPGCPELMEVILVGIHTAGRRLQGR